jgi:hypothetical protein
MIINHQFTKYLFYPQMAKSEIQKEIIQLGKLLVKQLDLEDSVDTLGRWMAHYLAEKIKTAENAKGKLKGSAQEECFHLILELWKHRWEVNREHRPLKDFDRLLELLQKIDPENYDSYYYRFAGEQLQKEDNPWLAAAYDIDKAARVCLKYLLSKAAEAAATEESQVLLATASVLGPDPDIMVIQAMFDIKDYKLDPEDLKLGSEFNTDFSKGTIENQISFLDKLVVHAQDVKAKLQSELK